MKHKKEHRLKTLTRANHILKLSQPLQMIREDEGRRRMGERDGSEDWNRHFRELVKPCIWTEGSINLVNKPHFLLNVSYHKWSTFRFLGLPISPTDDSPPDSSEFLAKLWSWSAWLVRFFHPVMMHNGFEAIWTFQRIRCLLTDTKAKHASKWGCFLYESIRCSAAMSSSARRMRKWLSAAFAIIATASSSAEPPSGIARCSFLEAAYFTLDRSSFPPSTNFFSKKQQTTLLRLLNYLLKQMNEGISCYIHAILLRKFLRWPWVLD